MNIKLTVLTASCALALAACGGNDAPPPQGTAATPAADTAPGTMDTAPATGVTPGTADTSTPDAVADTTMPAGTTAPGTTDPAGADSAVAGSTATMGDAATVDDCATTIEGNDAMQFNVDSITIPASCSDFTINLEHTGQLPEVAMGHNVVITSAANMQAVAADGLSAGADNEYVKADDDRVIAFTDIIGGGESTSVTFSTSDLQSGGPYEFFCSFPGHSALMKGTIAVQ